MRILTQDFRSGPCRTWHTDSMAANEDVKEQMRKALEAKKNKQSGKRDGVGPSQGKVHEHADREGGKREFRRKSG